MELLPVREETIAGMLADMTAGTETSRSLVERCLSRIDSDEPALKAWVSVDSDGALEQADRLDAERESGELRGPLHGIPIGIKDIVDVADQVTAAGSPLMSQDPPKSEDAELVAALRNSGAVIIGKTVTTQFACFDPPPTRNPWNPDRTPGGSSSGSAAAVAAGMIPAAIGSQTGGSITRPAAFCGVCGLKPTFGTVSLQGVVPVAGSLDHPGPIARTVEDLALVLAALCDEAGVPSRPVDSATRPLRLARLNGFSDGQLEPEALDALNQSIEIIRASGIEVADIDVPDGFDRLLSAHKVVMAAEAAAWHKDRFTAHRDDYGPCIATLIEEGLAASATEYLAAREHQELMTLRMNSLVENGFDALITPAAAGPAPDSSSTGNPCMNAPWSFTGMPTVSFPIGLSSDGMPISIQLAGARGDDWKLVSTASRCEAVVRTSL